nr:MAG TPA: hypothetical protein [Caudoviricetes sp.]
MLYILTLILHLYLFLLKSSPAFLQDFVKSSDGLLELNLFIKDSDLSALITLNLVGFVIVAI